MILGVGTDIVDIERIKAIYERHGERFLARCFTDKERKLIGEDVAKIARRYAAKEAASKAIGTGIGEQVGFHDLEILRNDVGQPRLLLSSAVQIYLRKQFTLQEDQAVQAHISLSDEPPYALAYVVIEA